MSWLLLTIASAFLLGFYDKFLLGIFLFREKQLHAKGICIAGIITGLILLS